MDQAGPTQEEIDQIHWWHTIEFPNGRSSKGGKSRATLEAESEIVFKYSVTGKSVLDVGAWNGFFTVASVQHRASRVLALDSPTWNKPGPHSGYAGFRLAKQYMAPGAEELNSDVMDISVERIGQFDVVLFLGVLYHLKHPLFVLERLAQIASERIVVETHLDAMDTSRPAAIFYPGAECFNDGSNWWGPNVACIEAMLHIAGFRRVEHVPYPGRKDRAFFHAWK
jgi:tRNA (mo5U34)-methyltransferase